jgi:hypothetical protein
LKSFVLYVASCLVAVALLGAIAWGFLDPVGRHMLLVSGAVAVGVQAIAFTVARVLRGRSLMLGWGIGSGLRLVVLVVYAVVLARGGQAPLAPALLSLVGFLFVTTVIEPVFLRL